MLFSSNEIKITDDELLPFIIVFSNDSPNKVI